MLSVDTASEAETERLACDVALALRKGDLVLLSGDMGSGKTSLVRSAIRYLLKNAETEVPSPTYTVSHVYAGDFQIAHYDLYRLSGLEELDELGWEEQLDEGLVLMEWPERCFETLPAEAIKITIGVTGNHARSFEFSGNPDCLERIKRSFGIRSFLKRSGYPDATREFLSGDASTRSYEFINGNDFLLMNSPRRPDGPPVRDGKPYSQIAHLAEDVTAFVAIDQLLASRGMSVPEIFASDVDEGLLLTEYLGSHGVLDRDGQPIPERYLASVDAVAALHGEDFISQVKLPNGINYNIPPYDRQAMMIEAELLLDWYAEHEIEHEIDASRFYEIWKQLIEIATSEPQTLVLRDFHSPNIIWLNERDGVRRTGLIDFQDAVLGPAAYDVASLAQDARVDVSHELETEILNHYCATRDKLDRDFDEDRFRMVYAIMAAQRATKVLGIFVRLDVRDGKPEYRKHIPRIKRYLSRSTLHPVLSDYREWLSTVIEL